MQTHHHLISYAQHCQLIETIAAKAKRTRFGLHDLSRDERVYYSVSVLIKTTFDHGLEGFITKHGEQLLGEAITGLNSLGAKQTLAVILRAASLMHPARDTNSPNNGDPCGLAHDAYDPEEAEILSRQHLVEELDDLDDLLYDDPDHLAKRLDEFAFRQNLMSKVGGS